MNSNKKIHLASYLKNNGNYTKSEVVKLIEENRVFVNNTIQPLSYVVGKNDVITVDGKIINEVPLVYYLYHKPKGIICTNNKSIPNNIISKLNLDQRVFTVGRLDKDSRGLILITNDGSFVNELINPISHVEKEYIVTVKYPVDKTFIKRLEEPIILRGKLTKPVKVIYIDDYHFKIILTEGKYRQIRRLVIYNKNIVTDLFRIRIGNYLIDNLEEGCIRKL